MASHERMEPPFRIEVRAAADAANFDAVATASMTATVGRPVWLGKRARGHEDTGAWLMAMTFETSARHLGEAPD